VPQKIIINSTPYEARVALLENEALVEIHIERTQQRNIAGNIYLGRVTRVLPGMQAAFVDIGLEKAGFIHASDLFGGTLPAGYAEDDADDAEDDADTETENGGLDAAALSAAYRQYGSEDSDELDQRAEADEFDELDEPDEPEDAEASDEPTKRPPPAAANAGPGGRGRRRRSSTPLLPLEDKIKKNQEILVQIAKESIGTKGPRLTSHISLPGRHLVYTPTAGHIGVSRRIADPKERKRLREIVADMKAEGGFIVRTACEGLTKKEIQDDMRFLLRLWSGLSKRREDSGAPALLHEDMDVILRIIRDLLTAEVDQVVVDNPDDYERLKEFAATFLPRSRSRIQHYDRPEPIFDHYKVEPQVAKALERRVYLKSGGHIVLDQTEALTAIDVNTGRFVGKRDQEETMLRTNLEASKAIVEQLRLRNLGGLIIIDFIDMERAANRNKVTETMRAALKKDKTRSNMRKISELGLVQMTRKRTRESLKQQLCDPCPYCNGNGVLRSVPTLAYNIFRHLPNAAAAHPNASTLMIKAHPEVVTFLYDEESEHLEDLERRLGKRFFLRATPNMHLEEYSVDVVGPESAQPPPSKAGAPRAARPKPAQNKPPDTQSAAQAGKRGTSSRGWPRGRWAASSSDGG
jgi:ribonuclease G